VQLVDLIPNWNDHALQGTQLRKRNDMVTPLNFTNLKKDVEMEPMDDPYSSVKSMERFNELRSDNRISQRSEQEKLD